MITEPRKAREVFLAALKLPPGQWDAHLGEACGADEGLRRRVRALLDAHLEAGQIPEDPHAPEPAAADRPLAEAPGTVVGPYRLLEPIGEGGFGVVFLAEQTEPIRRKVALKVLKPGMDTRQVIARFEAERQALALMDHPNIARVLDAGTILAPSLLGGEERGEGEGRPYFVMELVRGVPITDFCDRAHLAPRQRLELFVEVCRAVQHAHQKGVIHRDLKPSNVLVGEHDGRPVPKVIDFGVAKAAGGRLTERTLFTGVAQMVGTPLYMSPEQAGLSPDIDTRSDVYSLGVLLYELLTGTTPFDQDRLRDADYDEIRRIIREEEPPRPSARISTLGLAAATVPDNRRGDPRKLGRLVSEELDWVVMKALEKDRSRRYDSANALADDIERYLNDQPVLAGPPGAGYRLRKFARRHRGAVLAAALVLAALVTGLAGTTWGLVRAERARRDAEAARTAEADARRREADRAAAEAKQRARADAERARAQRERRVAEAVRRFLQVDLLRQADAFTQANTLRLAGGDFEARENPTVRELLDRAAAELTPEKIGAKFPKQPRVQAEILHTIGTTYLGVGEYGPAVAHLTRAAGRMARVLGPRHRKTLAARRDLADAYLGAGRAAEAVALAEEVRDACAARFGPDDPATVAALNTLATAYLVTGRTAEAVALREKVLDAKAARHGPGHPSTLAARNNLAGGYRAAGRVAESVALLEQVRGEMVSRFGPDHPATLTTLNSLALSYQAAGRVAESVALLEQVRAAKAARFGPDHPRTLNAMAHLAGAYRSARKFDRSAPLYEETLRLRRDKLGPDHPDTLGTMAELGVTYRAMGRQAEAVALQEQALALARERPGPAPPRLDRLALALAETYDRGGAFARAEPLYREFLGRARERFGAGHPWHVYALNVLGRNLLAQGRAAEAERALRECLALREAAGAAAWGALDTRALLAAALAAQGKYAEAGVLLRAGYDGLKERAAAPGRAWLGKVFGRPAVPAGE